MTVAVPTISVCGLVAMGDAMPKEVIEWVFGVPDAVIAGGKIYRLMNDISAFTVRAPLT
jgi:hypothetical protein